MATPSTINLRDGYKQRCFPGQQDIRFWETGPVPDAPPARPSKLPTRPTQSSGPSFILTLVPSVWSTALLYPVSDTSSASPADFRSSVQSTIPSTTASGVNVNEPLHFSTIVILNSECTSLEPKLLLFIFTPAKSLMFSTVQALQT